MSRIPRILSWPRCGPAEIAIATADVIIFIVDVRQEMIRPSDSKVADMLETEENQ